MTRLFVLSVIFSEFFFVYGDILTEIVWNVSMGIFQSFYCLEVVYCIIIAAK